MGDQNNHLFVCQIEICQPSFDTLSESSTRPYFDPSSISSAQPASISEQPELTIPSSENVTARRTGRQRRPPDRYGEWISNQQSVGDNNDQSTTINWV